MENQTKWKKSDFFPNQSLIHIGTVAAPVGPQTPDLLETGYRIFTKHSFYSALCT